MALIQCPNCGNNVSDKAVKCPHCGTTLHMVKGVGSGISPTVWGYIFASLLFVLGAVCTLSCFNVYGHVPRYYNNIFNSLYFPVGISGTLICLALVICSIIKIRKGTTSAAYWRNSLIIGGALVILSFSVSIIAKNVYKDDITNHMEQIAGNWEYECDGHRYKLIVPLYYAMYDCQSFIKDVRVEKDGIMVCTTTISWAYENDYYYTDAYATDDKDYFPITIDGNREWAVKGAYKWEDLPNTEKRFQFCRVASDNESQAVQYEQDDEPMTQSDERNDIDNVNYILPSHMAYEFTKDNVRFGISIDMDNNEAGKCRLEVNGTTFYGVVENWHRLSEYNHRPHKIWLYEIKGADDYNFVDDDGKILLSWYHDAVIDFKENWLYAGSDAAEAENPNYRIQIKRIE